MRRALVSVAAIGALLQGCIIYETESVDDRYDTADDDCDGRCPSGDDDDDDGIGDDDDDTTTDTGTTEPEPEPQIAFHLSVAQAAQGDTLLTWLQTDEPGFDYREIASVVFVGDVTVVDTVERPDEAFLLLEIPAAAEPGVVQVFVELEDGSAALIPGGFTIVEAPVGSDPCDCD